MWAVTTLSREPSQSSSQMCMGQAVEVGPCAGPQVELVYNISVPNSARRLPTASQMLATLARARGWTTGSGLPDEGRAGRQVRRPTHTHFLTNHHHHTVAGYPTSAAAQTHQKNKRVEYLAGMSRDRRHV